MWSKISLCHLILTFALLLSSVPVTAARDGRLAEYTIDHPLIYEDIWDLPPYTFLNKDGEPQGFNIDLIKAIMKRLDIPYIIRLKPTDAAYADLRDGKSDLMLGMHTAYHSQFGRYSRSVVGLFTHGVAHSRHDNTDINDLDDLRDHKVVVQANSFSHRKIIESRLEEYAMPYDDMSDAIQHVAASDSGQILWNTLSLKYMIDRYNLGNMTITPVNMPNGEYRFMSNDTELLALVDSVYETMTINEELQPIRNKWFYPEVRTTGIPEYVWYIAGVLALIIILLAVYNRIYHIREGMVNRANENQSRRLALYLRSGKLRLWTYDIERKMFMTLSSEGEWQEEYTTLGFSVFFNGDDYKRLCAAILDVSENRKDTETVLTRCQKPTTPDRDHYFDIKLSVLRRKNGRPSMLLGTQLNITEERQKRIETRNLRLKFSTIFNTVNVDMALYDSDGYLADLNAKACETLGDKQRLIDSRISIRNVLFGVDIDMEHLEMVYASSILPVAAGAGKNGRMPEQTKCYEMMVLPIFHDGRLIGFFATGRDVTELAENMKVEREKTRIIRQHLERQHEYVNNINYALEVSHIWLVNYYPDSRMLEITHDLKKPKLRLSQLRCVELLDSADKRRAVKLINAMDKRTADRFCIKLKTIFSDRKQRDMYLQLNGIPILDKDGRIDHYFGLCRNVSELEETERRLKMEMKKAQEAETVKSSFMKNMSYEIRTPLNAVVGFAELFDNEHDPEDEPVFMEEIKKNSNMLLRLVNEILTLSRIEANMVEINKAPADFAELFSAHCMMGWNQELSPDVKTVVESPYEHLVVDIDATQLGHVIEVVVANAAHFTTSGMIRGRYEYHHDELIISIDDTGEGIDEHTLKSMFGRMDFYEDVDHCCIRLDLMICKRLIERMGGRIDMESELGKGTTVWITVPCEATLMKKKNLLS